MAEFEIPQGQLARRMNGAIREMRARAQGAREASRWPWVSTEFAAALRGKARGYDEAADLLGALDGGRRIPKRRRWTGWVPPVRSNRRSVAPGDSGGLEGAEPCHCGDPIAYGYDGDPTHHRDMCAHCDLVRCDAYPGECGRDHKRTDDEGRS